MAKSMTDPEKIKRANQIIDAIESAGGVVDDVTINDDGNIELDVNDTGDVTTTGSGVVIKNGG